MLKITIIILNFNGWPDTKECLESLGRVEYDNFEVVLIDNASKEPMPILPVIPAKAGIQTSSSLSVKGGWEGFSPEPGSRVKPGMTKDGIKLPNLKITQIFNKENLGFAGANNQGIKMALANNADYLLLLNNDTTVEPDFLTKLVEEAANDESAGIVGPLIYFYDKPLAVSSKLIWSAGGKIANHVTRGELRGYQEIDEGEYQVPEQVDYISGTCFLIKSEVIKKIGLISEDYFLYYEDTDWCLRANLAGWRSLFVPAAKIYHKASRSTVEASCPYIYYHSRNGLMFGERFGNKLIGYFSSVWIALKQLVKLAVGYKRNWAKPVLRGVWDFWLGKKGKLKGCY